MTSRCLSSSPTSIAQLHAGDAEQHRGRGEAEGPTTKAKGRRDRVCLEILFSSHDRFLIHRFRREDGSLRNQRGINDPNRLRAIGVDTIGATTLIVSIVGEAADALGHLGAVAVGDAAGPGRRLGTLVRVAILAFRPGVRPSVIAVVLGADDTSTTREAAGPFRIRRGAGVRIAVRTVALVIAATVGFGNLFHQS